MCKIRNGFVSNSSSSSFIISSNDIKNVLFKDLKDDEIVIIPAGFNSVADVTIRTILEYIKNFGDITLLKDLKFVNYDNYNDENYDSNAWDKSCFLSFFLRKNKYKHYIDFKYVDKEYKKYFKKIETLVKKFNKLKNNYSDFCLNFDYSKKIKKRTLKKIQSNRFRQEENINLISNKIYNMIYNCDFEEEIALSVKNILVKKFGDKISIFNMGNECSNDFFGCAIEDYFYQLKNKFIHIENHH